MTLGYGRPCGPNQKETFMEDEERNILFVGRHADELDDPLELQFAKQLVAFFETKGYVTEKQRHYLVKFWNELNEAGVVD